MRYDERMTPDELTTLLTSLNDGDGIDTTLAYSLLNIARSMIEMKREWMVLRTVSSMSVSAGSDALNLTTMKINRFRGLYPVFHYDGVSRTNYRQVPANTPLDLLSDPYVFTYDHATKLMTLTRPAGTLYVNHIIENDAISASAGWQKFPAWAHPLLALIAVEMHKGGIDYDEQNARQAQYNSRDANRLLSMLERWDDELQLQMIGAIDPWQSRSDGYQSGKINLNEL